MLLELITIRIYDLLFYLIPVEILKFLLHLNLAFLLWTLVQIIERLIPQIKIYIFWPLVCLFDNIVSANFEQERLIILNILDHLPDIFAQSVSSDSRIKFESNTNQFAKPKELVFQAKYLRRKVNAGGLRSVELAIRLLRHSRERVDFRLNFQQPIFRFLFRSSSIWLSRPIRAETEFLLAISESPFGTDADVEPDNHRGFRTK